MNLNQPSLMTTLKKLYVRPIDFNRGCVDLTHGGDGRAVDELFISVLDNRWLRQMNDCAAFQVTSGRLVVATDTHVVSPLIFGTKLSKRSFAYP